MGTAKVDGELPDQTEAAEADGEGEDSSGDGATAKEDRYGNLEAQIGLLNDTVVELRQAVIDSRKASPATQFTPDEEINDDEPLTASKVSRIVNKSLTQAVKQSDAATQRSVWDGKAKEEFPLADPKFLREFKKQWNEQVNSGLDPNHPKAIYNVAKITAREVGVKKPAPKVDPDTVHTVEPTTRDSRPAASRNSAKSAISESDPRLRFYMMNGNRSKEQIESMKKKLADKDSGRRASR